MFFIKRIPYESTKLISVLTHLSRKSVQCVILQNFNVTRHRFVVQEHASNHQASKKIQLEKKKHFN